MYFIFLLFKKEHFLTPPTPTAVQGVSRMICPACSTAAREGYVPVWCFLNPICRSDLAQPHRVGPRIVWTHSKVMRVGRA